MPAGVDVAMLTDRTTTIRASVTDVEFEMALAVILVVLVICAVPAQHSGHHHSQPVGAAVAHRHLRRHVPGGLQPEQSVADGADHCHRLRGRRCHRDDREHLALHRGGRAAAGGGAEGRRADRLHHHLADRLADRGADSAAVHAGCRGTAVPRIRGDAGGDHPDLGGGVADAGADDVREAAQAPAADGAAAQTDSGKWFTPSSTGTASS